MEHLLKLITEEQSKRTEVFIFLWKILMCILTTNEIMNDYGYVFTKNEITLNLIISFLFTPEFILAGFVYLICVFAFFWFFKIIGLVIFIEFSKKQMSVEMLTLMLEKSKLITKSDNNEFGFLLTDLHSDNLIKAFIEDKNKESKCLNIVSNLLNLIFSTTIAYLQIYHKIPHLFGFGFGLFLVGLTFILIIIGLVILSLYAKSNVLELIRSNLSNYEYFKL
jgi:hypothetical protein